jgi:multidrug transporter EmrE-like cation transporter
VAGWLKWIPLFIISALFESITHLCLKKASGTHSDTEGFTYYKKLLRTPIVWLGIGFYVAQIAAWLTIAAYIPISIAFPLSSIEKFIMVTMAFVVFREKLNRLEIFSLILISAGIVCVTLSTHGAP